MSAAAVGAYIRLLAQVQQISLTDVTSAAGVALKYITQIESGEIKQPTAAILWKMTQRVNGSWEDVGRLMASDRPTAKMGRLAAMQWVIDRGLLAEGQVRDLQSMTQDEVDVIAQHLSARRRAKP